MSLRIGELCAGIGALGHAVTDVLDADVVWHAQYEPKDKHQYAARILARRFPDVPNLGDVTRIGYDSVPPVDMLVAGFPCQDISLAGRRVGMLEGTRSGLWREVARAINELRPPLVFLENVRSLTSARADSGVELCPWCMGDQRGGCLCGHSEPFSGIWPISGSMRSGRSFKPPTSAPRIDVSAYLYWRGAPVRPQVAGRRFQQTPTSNLGSNGGAQHPDKRRAGGHGPTLADEVEFLIPRLLPTVRTTDSNGPGGHGDGGLDLRTAVAMLPGGAFSQTR